MLIWWILQATSRSARRSKACKGSRARRPGSRLGAGSCRHLASAKCRQPAPPPNPNPCTQPPTHLEHLGKAAPPQHVEKQVAAVQHWEAREAAGLLIPRALQLPAAKPGQTPRILGRAAGHSHRARRPSASCILVHAQNRLASARPAAQRPSWLPPTGQSINAAPGIEKPGQGKRNEHYITRGAHNRLALARLMCASFSTSSLPSSPRSMSSSRFSAASRCL